MKVNLRWLQIIIGTLTISTIAFSTPLFASTFEIKYDQITEWIKIDTSSKDNITSNISVTGGLEASMSNCGYHCQIVKVGTTPFTDKGSLAISLSKQGSCHGSVELPFNASTGSLLTPTGVYHVSIEGNYCGLEIVAVEVSHNPNSGYLLTIK